MNYDALIESFPGKEGVTVVEPMSFDEISSLHNLTSLFIRLDSSSIFNRDHTWMKRLKRFHIIVGNTTAQVRQNKSRRKISVSRCEIFSNGELSGMLQFASHLYLEKCMGLRKVIVNKNSFNGLKSICIHKCSCYFTPVEEGSGQFDPLPNLEYLSLEYVHNLKSVSDFSQYLGTLGEPQSMLEHLEELTLQGPNQIRKLPLCIQTSNNIKLIKGTTEWWSQLEWDDDNFKSNLEHHFTAFKENLSGNTKEGTYWFNDPESPPCQMS
ncbi:hypothetical protein KY290_033071 [Solanum tuberosum]|uniref:Uncharacterized protein n=1 Tax=Solanum tuberosum TaxID=4113 RepID=A0ABQ7U132_SOLTU|nr:hypothetical protein KY285_034808 [Solanum tuberosum]KAH0740028.1 hypothetical protein KY290_033071 [Solanum tuberosum]